MSDGAPVLVIEDDTDVRELVAESLRELGYPVHEAATGEDGLSKARADTPRLVVLDIMLPGISGWQVLHELRAHDALERVPVLVLSILDQDVPSEQVDGYIVKPFTAVQVADRVRELAGPVGGAAE